MTKKKQKSREALINQWEKANISYQNYLNFIGRKEKKFELTYIDLLFVSNFKGGNASINEDEDSVNRKLKKYSEHLMAIDQEFRVKYLKDLSSEEIESLKNKALSFIRLTLSNNTLIDGFRCSYASALLHFHFPNLIPILDRRVLNGVNIEVEKNKQGQVTNIERYYPELITRFFNHLRDNPNKSLRDFDKENFVKPIEENEKFREVLDGNEIELKEIEVSKPMVPNVQQNNVIQTSNKGNIMGFENFERWLSKSLIKFEKFSTLGGRSHFYAHYSQQSKSITIRTSNFKLKLQKNPQFKGYLLKHNDIKKIFERFNNASESQKYMASYYELPPSKKKYLEGEYTTEYWPEAPDKVATPAIPAIIKYWIKNGKL